MQRTEVDGVPVLWAVGPAPLSAGLVFGVGRSDEDFVRGGVTHLVEHLAMHALGRTTLDSNATVDLHVTEFLATGRPEAVASFLERVCTALSGLPLDRLAVEADVLRAEDGHVAPAAVETLLGERYGVDGVGLAGFREPALLALRAEQVRDWAATMFTRANAALWLSGPPPEGLRLPLPDGPSPVRRPQHRRDLVLPSVADTPLDGAVGLGAEVPRLPGSATVLRVLADRVEDDLRHRRGLSYTVLADRVPLDGDRSFDVVAADVRDGQEAVAARALWQALTRLADDGPDQAEVDHDREGLLEHLADPRSAAEEARGAAVALVRGRAVRTADELRAEAEALTVGDVRQSAERLRDAALLVLPAGVDAALPALTPAPRWSPRELPGRVHARRRGAQVPRGARPVVGDEGVTLALGGEQLLSVRWDEAVGLTDSGDGLAVLLGVQGWSLPLDARDWKDGDEALARVRAAVPARLQVREDAVVPSGRAVVLVHAAPHLPAESLWPARRDVHVLATPDWTLVVRPHDVDETYAEAAGLSGALGRKGAVLVLVLAQGELELVVYARGKERDRHVWTGEPHDPAVLADLLGRDAEALRPVLGDPGRPEQVLDALVPALGVPPQTAEVLLGTPPDEVPGLVHEPARGLRAAVAASMRGEHDPPDSDALHHRITRWQRERPPGWRLTHAGFAVAQGALAGWFAVSAGGDLTSWRGALAAFFAVGALTSAWDVRPPARR